MQFEREQFDDSLLDDNYVSNTEDVDLGFQRMSDLDDADSNKEGNVSENTPSDTTPNSSETTYATEESLDVLGQFLKTRGVRDGKTIVYEDDDTGETNEVDFSTLSHEEQLQILNDLSTPNLSEDEIGTINYLRQNNVSLQDVITYFQEQAVKDYIASTSGTQTYSVDNYDDDVLYVADLKRRFPEMSEEELAEELEIAKSNEDLFKKKAETLRAAYKEEENAAIKQQEEAQQAQQQAYIQEFTNCLDNFSYVLMDHTDPKSDKFIIENRDRQAIYDYIFKKTPEGTTQLAADLNDPNVLIQLAWLRLYGQDAITDTSRYWKNELKKHRKAETKSAPKTAVVPKKQEAKQNTSLGSAWERYL